jgi:acetyl esterase
MPDSFAVKRVAALQLRGMGGPLRARVCWPPSSRAGSGLLLFFAHHGRLEAAAAVADGLCARAGVVVLSATCWMTVDDPFRTALDKASGVMAWAADHAADLEADPARLAVAGDRRGGALAAAMALHARDRRWPAITRQLLIEPDFGAQPPADPGLLGTDASLLAPVNAVSLAGVAPATVVTAGDGPLTGHGRLYSERLRRAGVEVEERHYTDRDAESDAVLAALATSLRRNHQPQPHRGQQ